MKSEFELEEREMVPQETAMKLRERKMVRAGDTGLQETATTELEVELHATKQGWEALCKGLRMVSCRVNPEELSRHGGLCEWIKHLVDGYKNSNDRLGYWDLFGFIVTLRSNLIKIWFGEPRTSYYVLNKDDLKLIRNAKSLKRKQEAKSLKGCEKKRKQEATMIEVISTVLDGVKRKELLCTEDLDLAKVEIPELYFGSGFFSSLKGEKCKQEVSEIEVISTVSAVDGVKRKFEDAAKNGCVIDVD